MLIYFLSIFIFVRANGEESTVLNSLEICCTKGEVWSKNKNQDCLDYPTPVKNVIPEMQQICFTSIQMCCTRKRREEECADGKEAALNGNECLIGEDRIEKKTYEDCCTACTLGITVASMEQTCGGVADKYGMPWQEPFMDCCEDYLLPLTNETMDNSTCSEGFMMNEETLACEDIDECGDILNIPCGVTETCINSIGSYECEPTLQDEQCPDGFRFFLISCIDIDECEEDSPCNEDENCVNAEGSYTCESKDEYKENNLCPDGYTIINGKCTDINECQTGAHNCEDSQRCDNTIGSFVCVRLSNCGTGYTVNFDTGECEDNDECAQGTHHCDNLGPEYMCRNIKGSFRCEKKRCNIGEILGRNGLCTPLNCGVGFEPGPLGNCMDIDECATPDTCNNGEKCINNMGSYNCLSMCERGLKLNSAIGICEDIDECALGTAQCFHGSQCRNTIGSYMCSCGPGFREINGVCKDINECALNSRFLCGIDSECQNTEGSYRCICKQGFKSVDNRCTDIDECEEVPDICGHTCQNTYGSYWCRCQLGYQLAADKRTCEDIDECQEQRCIGVCMNEPGSYRCDCPAGYRLDTDGKTCQDINECNEENPCQEGEFCQNTKGSYKCMDVSCPDGYIKEQGPNHRCKKLNKRCRIGDMDCLKKPVSLSYNFLAIVSKIPVATSGLELFTMQSARYAQISTKFDLVLLSARAPRGIRPATRQSFYLRTGVHHAMLALREPLDGPQEIELELHMEMYYRGKFAGAALAKVFIFVGGHPF